MAFTGRSATIRFEVDGKEYEIGGKVKAVADVPREISFTMDVVMDACSQSRLRHLWDGYPTIPQAIECPGCGGEGGDEGPTTCGHGCDWCGGCRDQPQECGQCEGAQEVPLYVEECHATDDLLHCAHWGDGDDEAGTCCHCGAKP